MDFKFIIFRNNKLKKLIEELSQNYEKRATPTEIDEISHRIYDLIRQGADPNLIVDEIPVLSHFIHYDRDSKYFTIKSFEILLNLGCELGTMDELYSPIGYIFGDYKDHLVQFLLDKKLINPSDYIHYACNLSTEFSDGRTMNIIKSLVNAGADLFIKDDKNKLPIDWATDRQNSEAIIFLQKTMDSQLNTVNETSIDRLMINLMIKSD